MATTTEKEIQVASGLGDATPDQVLAGVTFSSENGFNLVGTSQAELKADINKNTLGYSCKNLLVYPYANTTRTAYGVTYTDNGDGTVSASGISTGAANFVCQRRTDDVLKLPKGKYILSGCPAGGSSTTYEIQLGYSNDAGNYVDLGREYGNGLEFEVTEENTSKSLQVMLVVKNGATAPADAFRPMIRLASDTDDAYEPYKKNVEKRLADLEDNFPKEGSIPVINVLSNPSSATNDSKFMYWKNPFNEIHFHIDFVAKSKIVTNIGAVTLYTLPEGYRPSTEFKYRALMRYYNSETEQSDIGICYLTIKTDGSVQITGEPAEIPVGGSIGFGGVMM